MNDAAREVRAALGIGVLGSINAIAYRASLDSEVIPDAVREVAGELIGAALSALEQFSGPVAAEAAAAVTNAFADAFGITMIASAVTAVLGAIAIIAWNPNRGRVEAQIEKAEVEEGMPV